MIVTDEKYEQSLNFIGENASEVGRMKGLLNGYDYQLKVIEASEMSGQFEGAIESRRAIARSSEAYKNLVDKISACQEIYHDLQSQMQFHYARLDCWRSECANLRGLK